MSYLVFFSMTPIGQGESVSRHVAKAVAVVARSGWPWQLGPMGTTFEAPTLAAVFRVLAACDRALAGCRRVSTLIKIDRRAGGSSRLASKVAAVRRRLRG
jgi:uncharacterized protein (TIGR00106 family)